MSFARIESDPFVAIASVYVDEGKSSAKALALLMGVESAFDFANPVKSFEAFWPLRASGLSKGKLSFLEHLLKYEEATFHRSLLYHAEKLLLWSAETKHKRFSETLIRLLPSIEMHVALQVALGLARKDDSVAFPSLQEKTGVLDYYRGRIEEMVSICASAGSSKVLSYLLQWPCNADAPDGNDSTPPLVVASKQSDLEIMRLLLTSGANPGLTDPRGNSPLHFCVMNSCFEGIELLLEYGGDPRALNQACQTPLSMAEGMFHVMNKASVRSVLYRHLGMQLPA